MKKFTPAGKEHCFCEDMRPKGKKYIKINNCETH